MSTTQIPEVLWAQRSSSTDAEKNYIYLTITVPDVPASSLKLDLQPTTLNFTGTSESLKRTYHLELEFYAEIDPKESKINHTGKNVQIVLRKKELKEEYWPRLLKESKKAHFLKTDFDKWVDEDEQDEAPEDDAMADMGGMPGGMGGGAGGMGGMDMASMMGGMGGMGGGDFGGIDFSKLGAAGMGGLGDMDDEEGEGEGEEEMPALEGEEEAGGAKAAPKIEEVQ